MRHWIKSFWVVCVFLILYLIFSLLTAQAQSPNPTPRPRVKPTLPNGPSPIKQPSGGTDRSANPRMATAGCNGASSATLPAGATIVDDSSSQFHRYGDNQYWGSANTSPSQSYNSHMYYTWNNDYSLYTWAVWDAPISPGLYEVWAFIPSVYATTTNAQYYITHSGVTSSCSLNQSVYYAYWVFLGVYQFSLGTDNIELTSVTGEQINTTYVGFDAIAYVRQPDSKVYLPFIAKAPSQSELYARVGIHLGNRDHDWNQPVDFLARLRGSGWPRVVVVLSHQVYNIVRDTGVNNCNITGATVKNTAIFNYLRDAAQAGTRVLVRIWPSPGDFQDTFDYSKPHNLFNGPGQTPQNHTYCGTHVVPGTTDYWPMPQFFRAIDDLANEMNAIHNLNASNGFSEYGFIPANEPNAEWYAGWRNTIPDWFPQVYNREAWQAMDAYFQSLYDWVHNISPSTRILTPTMAQGNFAETRQLSDSNGICGAMVIYDQYGNQKSGYDFMPLTYNSKNDGFLWHNYYRQGRESWTTGDACGISDHIFQYFPSNMQSQIRASGKTSFIDETDLFSPCQQSDSSITDKDTSPTATSSSLWTFVGQEQGAQYTIAWLLSEDPYSIVPQCPTGLTNNQEIRWHEAYRTDGTQRAWFAQWWQP